jgi:hydrogenase nickel incorporation protein HypA/HybF
MHELSIVGNIIEIAENEARKALAERITELEMDIGTVSGIESDALNFAFESVKPKTMLKNAEIKINIIQAKAVCSDCRHVFETENVYTLCPVCDSFKTEIIQGKEIKIKSILVD